MYIEACSHMFTANTKLYTHNCFCPTAHKLQGGLKKQQLSTAQRGESCPWWHGISSSFTVLATRMSDWEQCYSLPSVLSLLCLALCLELVWLLTTSSGTPLPARYNETYKSVEFPMTTCSQTFHHLCMPCHSLVTRPTACPSTDRSQYRRGTECWGEQ